jgi:SAM-dependent methyltransferase
MPVSHTYQISSIMESIILCNPKSILEVGIGFGKYGVLCYERLNLWWHGLTKEDYKAKKVKIDGVEIYKDYKNPIYDFIYDNVFFGNALNFISSFSNKSYDLILLIDVLEHFNQEDGIKLLNECKRVSKNILISTPKDIGKQSQHFGNEAECHKFQWTKELYNEFFPENKTFIDDKHSIILFYGEKWETIYNQKSFTGELK